MNKKQHNPFRKALIVSLIQQGELTNPQIAAQAKCSVGYVASVRWKLKKAAKTPPPTVFEPIELEPLPSSPLWLTLLSGLTVIFVIITLAYIAIKI